MASESVTDVYNFRSVLVSGGAGFICSNFLNYMVKRHPTVTFVNIDCLFYSGSERNILVSDSPNYHFVYGSITDSLLVYDTLIRHQIDTVLHFSAKSHVDESFANPEIYLENNVRGTFVLLESCRKYGKIRRFLHVSTDEVFGENRLKKEAIMDEESSLNPSNPYSASKAAAELYVRTYGLCFGLPIVVVRSNNVFGPRQYPEKLIPKFIYLLRSGRKCPIHGSGLQSRAFIHVDDVVRAYETLLIKGTVGQKYNIGTSEKLSVLEVAKLLIGKLKTGERWEDWIEFVPDRNYNDLCYDISWNKIAQLGWTPQISFSEGIDHTINWYDSINPSEHWPLLNVRHMSGA